jgi:hypothetical protein
MNHAEPKNIKLGSAANSFFFFNNTIIALCDNSMVYYMETPVQDMMTP